MEGLKKAVIKIYIHKQNSFLKLFGWMRSGANNKMFQLFFWVVLWSNNNTTNIARSSPPPKNDTQDKLIPKQGNDGTKKALMSHQKSKKINIMALPL